MPYSELPDGDGFDFDDCDDPWDWCPSCEQHFATGTDCPGCGLGTWGWDDVIGLGPEPDTESDDWYRYLCDMYSFPGWDGSDPFRD